MSFEYVDTNAKAGDGANQTLTKILQRLNWNASVQPDQPSANVVVTNTPLQVRDTVVLAELAGMHAHEASIDTKLTATNALLSTIEGDLDVVNVRLADIETNTGMIEADTTSIDTKLTTTNASLANIDIDTSTIAARLFDNGFSAAQLLSSIENYTSNLSGIDGNLLVLINTGAPIKDENTGDTAIVNPLGELQTVSSPVNLAVVRSGLLSGKVAMTFHLFGRRAGFNSTSILQDVGEWLGTSINLFPELAGTEALEVVSSDAEDDNTPGGTGTRSVRIVYLDTNYAIQSLDVALNGLAPVGLGAVRMLFVYWMEAVTGGSSEVSVGNIDLRTVAGSTIQERITAGGNKSLSARFMVPDGFDAYISIWDVSTIGTSQEARLRTTAHAYNRALAGRYLFADSFITTSDGSISLDQNWAKCPPRSRIKVSTIAGNVAGTNKIQSSITVLLVAQ